MSIAIQDAKKRLALVWFAGAGVSFLVLLGISLFGEHETEVVPKLWDWFLPAVTPNLSLIVGVLVNDLRQKIPVSETDGFVYHLAFWLSLLYVVLLCLTPLATPLTGSSMQEVLGLAHYWLAPLQALATAALGAFYVRRESKEATS